MTNNSLLSALDINLARGRDLQGTEVRLELSSLEVEDGLQFSINQVWGVSSARLVKFGREAGGGGEAKR